MVIVELVVDVAAVAPVPNHASGPQQAERLRHLRLGRIDLRGDLVDAEFVGTIEPFEDAETGGIAEQSEEFCRSLGGSEVE